VDRFQAMEVSPRLSERNLPIPDCILRPRPTFWLAKERTTQYRSTACRDSHASCCVLINRAFITLQL
jgi:hypothetical protein